MTTWSRVVGAGNQLYGANMYGLRSRGGGIWAFERRYNGPIEREWVQLPGPPLGELEYVDDIYCHITGVWADADGGPQSIAHELRAITTRGHVYCYDDNHKRWSEVV